MTKRRKNYS